MTFLGDPNADNYPFQILFMGYAVIASMLFFLQIIFLQKLAIFPVYILPFLSCFIAYENVVLYMGSSIETMSNVANAAYVFHSLQIPMFISIIFELAYSLHEARSARFCCIPFDQGEDVPKCISLVVLWTIRLICLGLFIMNILVDFNFASEPSSKLYAGRGGYATLAEHSSMIPLWLALIPPMTLSVIGSYVALVIYRFSFILFFPFIFALISS